MQAADETEVGKFAQQREGFRRVDAIVIGRARRYLDLRLASGDAIDAHQPRLPRDAVAQKFFQIPEISRRRTMP